MVLRFNRQASGEKPPRFPKASAKVQPYNEYTNLYESFFEKKSMLYMKTLINRRIYQNKQKRGDKSLIKIHINIYNTESMQGQKKQGHGVFSSQNSRIYGTIPKKLRIPVSIFVYSQASLSPSSSDIGIVTSTLSIRAPSISTTSNTKPFHSIVSPLCGICCSCCNMSPPNV